MSLSFVRNPHLDDQLTRYLLGALPEAQAEQLDELSVIDDEFADRLRVAETDLIDAYVRGSLTGDERARFDSHYLASPRRRAKVAFAKRFLNAVDAQPAPARARNRFAAWALAAAAALALSTGTLLVRTYHLSRDIRDAVARTADANHRADALSEQLSAQRTATESARQALSGARATAVENGLALVLLPATRGAGPVPAIDVQRNTNVVTLELRLDAPASPPYAVALKDPATNRTVWRGRVGAALAGTPAYVPVQIPADVLKAQHYALDLFDARHGATGAFVASYAFEVVRR